jgi:hypothetical protein
MNASVSVRKNRLVSIFFLLELGTVPKE